MRLRAVARWIIVDTSIGRQLESADRIKAGAVHVLAGF
jgi:hypothetical protein